MTEAGGTPGEPVAPGAGAGQAASTPAGAMDAAPMSGGAVDAAPAHAPAPADTPPGTPLDTAEAPPAAAASDAPRPSFPNWIREGARTLFFLRPRWERVRATPWTMALLVVLDLAAAIVYGRLYVDGPADFHWRAMLAGWAGFVLIAWNCYALRPRPLAPGEGKPWTAPGASWIITLILAQAFCLTVLLGCSTLLLMKSGVMEKASLAVRWAVWLLPTVWAAFAQLFAMFRSSDPVAAPRVLAIYTVGMAAALTSYFVPPPPFWIDRPGPQQGAAEEAQEEPIRFTQALIEEQAPLLMDKLEALAPQRPGTADMYTLTFAPYEGEEVFRRESRMVSDVMAKRFDAAGRGLQLLNHREHLEDLPWATPLNLQRAILGLSKVMNRDEDVLFIHLTSHGARDGELAANFWPLDPEAVTPPDLRKWLDEAGIKHRVISISACFSGSWIASLASEDTLVMTASDADHTSYGCGKKSPLTFFGRAMYDEQLRSNTLSFEEAHAASRKVIEKREKEAGKDDGYSNPQISVGARIRPYLESMRARLPQQAAR